MEQSVFIALQKACDMYDEYMITVIECSKTPSDEARHKPILYQFFENVEPWLPKKLSKYNIAYFKHESEEDDSYMLEPVIILKVKGDPEEYMIRQIYQPDGPHIALIRRGPKAN